VTIRSTIIRGSKDRNISFFIIFIVLTLLIAIEGYAQEGSPRQRVIPVDWADNMAAPLPWMVQKTEWGISDEENYIRYITTIGEGISRGLCATVSSCFHNPQVNPYANSANDGLKFYYDCADFPYFLRAYYAWKNQLPFGFVSGVSPIQGQGDVVKDIRYSPYGNVVRDRYSILTHRSRMGRIRLTNAVDVFNHILPDDVSSASFRVSYSGMDADRLFSDFYPIRITRDAVRPGTVIYDPNGHVVTVYKVTKDGRVYYIDAHPDNSLTAGLYNSRFMRSYPGQGAGFKNWRPLTLVDASWDGNYGYVGGKIIGAKDRELPLYSTEQFFGTTATPDWHQAGFVFQGQRMDYYDWVRNRLADGPLVENPVDDVKIMTDELCNGMKERAVAVQVGIVAGIQLKDHPYKLPNNVYGADGEWETYATPARDARLKVAFKELRTYVQEALRHYKARDGKVGYNGQSLSGDMLDAYKQYAGACKITYKNSNGQNVTINLEQARARIYDLSFDPYHCVELRWGAQGNELNSCRDDNNKRQWYDREKWLRFQHERNTDAFTGYTLDQITGPMPGGAGVASGQDLDVIAFLSKN
jgi:hypothetical protein